MRGACSLVSSHHRSAQSPVTTTLPIEAADKARLILIVVLALLPYPRAVYGMAGKLPDRGAVADVLKGYQEVQLDFA